MEQSRKKQEEARRKHDLKVKIREIRNDAKNLRKDMNTFKTKVNSLQKSSAPAIENEQTNAGDPKAARDRAPRPIEGEIMRLRRQNATARRSVLVLLMCVQTSFMYSFSFTQCTTIVFTIVSKLIWAAAIRLHMNLHGGSRRQQRLWTAHVCANLPILWSSIDMF
eukprot:SAG31_NODE_11500_length_1023_cov_1.481602_1_plen_164_part_10